MRLSLGNRSSELLMSPFQKWSPSAILYLSVSLRPDGELLWNRGCIQIIIAAYIYSELCLVLCEYYF